MTPEWEKCMEELRMISATQTGNLILPRAQMATFKSIEEASNAAAAEGPELPWRRIFAALEAAGLVAFGIVQSGNDAA